ncbi:MAG: hypothetical protein EP330_09395 [Deltaproteobacteria bacterium]|nr:MAG: hypothetical protein EP330_09395 [Deltaproteobacteria bacterium]
MHLLLAIALAHGAPAPAHDGSVRGVTVSCPTWGYEWGTDAMVETLDELEELGVNWVAIHPYARIRADGTVAWRSHDESPEWIARPIREAHARGMKVLIKPHLAYWGSPFAWRGEITFDEDEEWARFFTTYEGWVTEIARHSDGADAFAVGTELDRTVHRDEWRAVITAVRAESPAALTYAANWTDFAEVPFWGELDAVGVQAYFPLVDANTEPTDAALSEGWKRVVDQLMVVAEAEDKPVVLTELGYPRSERAAREPWQADDDANFEHLQTRALRTAIAAIDAEPRIVGAFLWKWFPGQHLPRDFALQRPAARAVLSEEWAPRIATSPPTTPAPLPAP